ncbi:MAG: response regulator transcription factor [Elusimicrobia bacterium]|nr:response regulator transcription factor [Elusimicrobiota bacterium]MDE2314757.1 response regulator transcription factor [Elusimicrobiota bacterium]
MSRELLLIGLTSEDQEASRAVAAAVGYSASSCLTGVEAAKVMLEKTALGRAGVELALLEKDLPDMSAPAWISMIRKTRFAENLPVVVLSRGNCPESSIVEMFDAGADDFIQMPCAPQELAARIRAVVRRRQAHSEESPLLEIGPILLDPGARQCRVRGKIADLRPREFELLDLLMRKAGRTLSRPYLLETIWGMDKTANTRAIDVGVSRLRQALGARAGRWIETVERYGYRFKLPEG